jgi:hypothetical protein
LAVSQPALAPFWKLGVWLSMLIPELLLHAEKNIADTAISDTVTIFVIEFPFFDLYVKIISELKFLNVNFPQK